MKFRLIGYRLLFSTDGRYWTDAPEHFGRFYPCTWDERTNRVTQKENNWYASELRTILSRAITDLQWTIEGKDNFSSQAYVINTLDPVFGHALYKAAAARSYIDSTLGKSIVVLCTRQMRRYIPGATGYIIVDSPLSTLRSVSLDLDGELHRRFIGSDRPCFVLCQTSRRGTQASLFPPQGFRALGKERQKDKVLIVLRSDRCWGGANWLQSLRVCGLTRQLEREWPELKVVVYLFGAGATRIGRDRGWRCFETPNEATDDQLIEDASASVAVFGVHGSHMIVPSNASWGYLELLPKNKIGNYGQAAWPAANRAAIDIFYAYRVLHGDRFLLTISSEMVRFHLEALIGCYYALERRLDDSEQIVPIT